MSTVKTATVHYRKLIRSNGSFLTGKTLSDAISEVLEKRQRDGVCYKNDWRLRVAQAPSDPNQQRLINDCHIDAESVFGILCAFTSGDMQALIAAAASPGQASVQLPSADILESRAPSGNEYLDGVAYWLVIGDHCYIVQNVAVRAKALEEYLTWLLRDETQVIGPGETIMLQAEFEADSGGGDLGDLQSIEIGGLAMETVQDIDSDPLPTSRTKMVKERKSLGDLRVGFEKAMKVVEDILGSVGTRRIMESMPADAALDVTVNIGYRATRRKIDRTFMNDIATGLRNIDDGELRVRGKDGRIQGDKVWLQTDMPFERVRSNSSLLDLGRVDEFLEFLDD